MSTPISHALDRAFGGENDLLSAQGGKSALSIVYVSSDRSRDEYDAYIRDRKYWMAIPFESPQRDELKRHFSACARIELEELDMDRKHEIPTIIVIDSRTHGIITTNGANDVAKMGRLALEHWKDMMTDIRESEIMI